MAIHWSVFAMAGFCRWSSGCISPGPFVAWFTEDGNWHECIDPDKADRPIYCIAHAREFQQINFPHSLDTTIHGGNGVGHYRNHRAAPPLLFCRRSIDSAIADASTKINPPDAPDAGSPTEDAMLARAWIEYKPDHQDREDYWGSFEWCCAWLGIDAEKQRREALDKIDAALVKAALNVKRKEFAARQAEVVDRALGREASREKQQIAYREEQQQQDALQPALW